MPKVVARSPLSLWFLVAAPARSLRLCSWTALVCSWVPSGHHLDLVGQETQEERKNWSQTVRGRDRKRHRYSQRQRVRGEQRKRQTPTDTEKQREPGTDIKKERARGGQRNAETAKDTNRQRHGQRNREDRLRRGKQTQVQSWPQKGRENSTPHPHLELVPGVGMEAVTTAASQVQAGTTKGLVRAAPADEAATVVVPG